ncbi:rhodanese-like domain-containing protein [Atopobacter sp. AH10]|uniref:rhodanese-like domain-containing protein n=1 Tax=Atopobacter sp. AH10 TaxID=2315861 RepID=UPI0018F2F2BE|nr:rhodanese-like domain-containing protein [Atopobacter sp. AH10]
MKMNKYVLTTLSIAAALSLATSTPSYAAHHYRSQAQTEKVAKAKVKEMKGKELDKYLGDDKQKENYLVIDVRSVEEYEANHVKWAINMPIDEFAKNVKKIKGYKDKNVVTICNSGKKSGEAAKILTSKGFTKVYNAEGVKSYKYKNLTQVKYVLGKEAQKLVDTGDYYIIDARMTNDYNQGHLKGAINIAPNEIDKKIKDVYKKVDKDKKILTYCYSGNKSNVIAQKLVDKGYKDVTNANDGTKEYDGYKLTDKK